MLDNEKECRCKATMYAYTDEVHTIFLCFKCGRFEGMSGGDNTFVRLVSEEPALILQMIEDETLKPVR